MCQKYFNINVTGVKPLQEHPSSGASEAMSNLDVKPRAHSPSEGNVVDHHAANGVPLVNSLKYTHAESFQVTDEPPAGPKRFADPKKSTMIQVQPLKRSEMQVSLNPFKLHHIYILSVTWL